MFSGVATQTNPANPAKAPIPAVASEPPAEAARRTAPAAASPGGAVSAAIGNDPNGVSEETSGPAAKPETGVVEACEENALVSSSEALKALEGESLIERQSAEARLPVQLDVGIPIRDFRVKNLLVLVPGALIESQWEPGEDVPVASGEVQLAWSEFEVVDAQLAVRLTRLI